MNGMKPIHKNLLLLVLISALLLSLLYKKRIIVDNSPQFIRILDSINKANKERIKSDSIVLSKKVDSLNKRIKTVNYLRKNERNKYEETISKLNRPFDSTMFVRFNDSIKKVCCPNHTN